MIREGSRATLGWLSSVTLVYAVAFYALFMHMKHAQPLRSIIPFGDDPYDAIGSFAAISAVLLGVLGVARAVMSAHHGSRRHFLLRTCCAVFLAALVAAMGDGVAMLRHPAAWYQRPGAGELLSSLALLVLTALGGTFWSRSLAGSAPRPPARSVRQALIVCGAAAAALYVYPDDPHRGFLAALAAIGAGILLLFVPLAALLEIAVPEPAPSAEATRSPAFRRWSLALVAGLGVGVAALFGELSGDPAGLSAGRLAVVSAVFVGTGAAGLLAGYFFLAHPLGLSGR